MLPRQPPRYAFFSGLWVPFSFLNLTDFFLLQTISPFLSTRQHTQHPPPNYTIDGQRSQKKCCTSWQGHGWCSVVSARWRVQCGRTYGQGRDQSCRTDLDSTQTCRLHSGMENTSYVAGLENWFTVWMSKFTSERCLLGMRCLCGVMDRTEWIRHRSIHWNDGRR